MEKTAKLLSLLQWVFIFIQFVLFIMLVIYGTPLYYTLSAGGISIVFGMISKILRKRLKLKKDVKNQIFIEEN